MGYYLLRSWKKCHVLPSSDSRGKPSLQSPLQIEPFVSVAELDNKSDSEHGMNHNSFVERPHAHDFLDLRQV